MEKNNNYNVFNVLTILFFITNCGFGEYQARDRQEVKTFDANQSNSQNAKKSEANSNMEPLVISSGVVESADNQDENELDDMSSLKEGGDEDTSVDDEMKVDEDEMEEVADEDENEEEIVEQAPVVVSSKGINGPHRNE
ncbi:MAG: hypothetical protein AB8G05_15090 [Oligoflexales bacterium]